MHHCTRKEADADPVTHTKVLQFKISTNIPCILRLVLLTDFCGDRADMALRALSRYALLAHLSGGLGEGGDAVVGYAGYIVTCPAHSGSAKHGIKMDLVYLNSYHILETIHTSRNSARYSHRQKNGCVHT